VATPKSFCELAEVLAPLSPPQGNVHAALVELATGTADPWVRVQAARALAQAGTTDPHVTAALVELATSTADPRVRVQAAQVLAQAGTTDPRVTAALVELATSTADPRVRVQAAQALAQAGTTNPQVITAVLHVARHSEDWMVRQSAVNVLRSAAPTPELQADLISFFSDSDNDVRRTAGETLIAMARDYPDAAPDILASLAHACTSLQLAASDKHERRTGWDDAYTALWAVTEALAANRSARIRRYRS
jgi:HEAT repeat protein